MNGRETARRLLAHLVGEARAESALSFLEDLGWIGFSFTLARVLTGLTSILGARFLGASEYGRFNLVMATGPLIATLMLVGMNSSILRYGSGSANARAVFVTCVRIVALGSLVTSLLLATAGGPLQAALNLPPETLWFGWIYALAYAWYSTGTSALQALGRFVRRGWTEIVLAALTLVLFVAAGQATDVGFRSLVFAYLAAYAVAVPVTLWHLRSWVQGPALDSTGRRPLLEYGLYTLGSGIGSFLTWHLQAILLNVLLSTREVGIYSAHSVASIGLAMFAGSALHTVLFPRASASTNRWGIWTTLWRTWRLLFVPVLGGFALTQVMVLWLIGRPDFEPRPGRIALFALCATVVLLLTSLGQIVGAEGLRGARLGVWLSLTMGCLSLLASLFLIPRFGLEGAVASVTLSYGVGTVWLCAVSRRYCQ